MSERPTSDTILGEPHVVEWRKLKNEYGTYTYGRVVIDTGQSLPLQARSFVHERSHGIFRSFQESGGTINEEQFARLFELGVADLFRANPAAVEWIKEALNNE